MTKTTPVHECPIHEHRMLIWLAGSQSLFEIMSYDVTEAKFRQALGGVLGKTSGLLMTTQLSLALPCSKPLSISKLIKRENEFHFRALLHS